MRLPGSDMDEKIKGLSVATQLGARVPTGLIILPEAYRVFAKEGAVPQGLRAALTSHLSDLERRIGQNIGRFESDKPPLLFSLRCGDKNGDVRLPESMVNIGLAQAEGQAKRPDAFADLLQEEYAMQARQFQGSVLAGAAARNSSHGPFGSAVDELLYYIERIYAHFQELEQAGQEHFNRWLIVQKMVYANWNAHSCSGRAYTRNPRTGQAGDFGKYLMRQSGAYLNLTPIERKKDLRELWDDIPEAYDQLKAFFVELESYYRTPRYVEFVVEDRKLYILQNTRGSYTAR
ncbi:hypothetical protein YDYSG_28940 [Paenibacillus tyrfis]|uniref:hypothetical protein n=1 Tax=Paenibacillus tyrfis TaxID=1501230 RepID=UPI002492389A|nr:hypothetical protein [Paenibacillus tyrfis]GLI06864.1 hypothetical protein YDYSG_28940 [Paenibacillus tyrfis]